MGQSTADRVMATGRPGAPEAKMQKWKIHQANMQSPSSGWVRGSGWVPKVDLYHFFTNMQVWAICQDQCEYHTIQKAEIPVWDILAWNVQVKVETSDWNNTE